MKYDQVAVRDAQRLAFMELAVPKKKVIARDPNDGMWKEMEMANPYFVRPESITVPAVLEQDQLFSAASQQLNWDFSINGQSAANSNLGAGITTANVVLGKNNLAAIYALQIWLREGNRAVTGIRRSRGITPADDSIYTSTVSVKLEQSTLIDKVPGQGFKDVYTNPFEWDQLSGLLLINPVRILTGELGVFNVALNILQPISDLVITAQTFAECRLWIAYGQASAVR